MEKIIRNILNEIVEQGGPVRPTISKNEPSMEMSIEDIGVYEIADRVKKIDINTLTPIEAMNFIFELKKLLN